ncbi:LysR family transcriptional regulator [Vibrio rhodolitus]|uniref:LysR family transcriptional regulator n=1 Tax=Vibrio rhodolitus TaxID=2231649 RepID=UPI001FC90B1A|nr:LysR family transcriptional regulator [Vibrio rhodolitus]
MNFNDLLILKTIAERGSFVSAAEHLDLPTSTVSRRIAELEKQLGVKLLQRTSRTVQLSELGELLHQQTAPHLEGLIDSVTFLQDQQEHVSGKLVVVSPIFLAYFRLSEWLGEFQARYPNLEIQYRISNSIEDIHTEQVDLAIRPGPLKDSSLVAKFLYQPEMRLYAGLPWLKNHVLPAHPHQLTGVRSFTVPYFAKTWNLHKGSKTYQLTTDYQAYANDYGPLAQAMIHNAVIGVLPTVYGDEFVRQAKLIKLLPEYKVEPPGPVYAVYPSKQFLPRKTQLLLRFLEEKFAAL